MDDGNESKESNKYNTVEEVDSEWAVSDSTVRWTGACNSASFGSL